MEIDNSVYEEMKLVALASAWMGMLASLVLEKVLGIFK